MTELVATDSGVEEVISEGKGLKKKMLLDGYNTRQRDSGPSVTRELLPYICSDEGK